MVYRLVNHLIWSFSYITYCNHWIQTLTNLFVYMGDKKVIPHSLISYPCFIYTHLCCYSILCNNKDIILVYLASYCLKLWYVRNQKLWVIHTYVAIPYAWNYCSVFCILCILWIMYFVYASMYMCMYVALSFSSWPVGSSVITATSMLVCSPVASELYNITVTCTIHPNSTADQCIVMAMDDGEEIRTGS